jgi:POT family proton-dependent oligopeptide transporter
MIDGQRYEVQVDNYADQPSSSGNEVRYLVDGDQRLRIKGNSDGSISLLAADGSTARTIEKGGYESGGDRDPFFVAVMLVALSLVSIGNGFFKPNISTMVGSLYEQGDRRRDAGFTIFYMGINMGSIGAQLLCPLLADAFGWWAGFGLAAAGMLFSWTLIQFDGGRLDGYGEPPERTGPDRQLVIYGAALLAVPVF